MTSHPKTRGVTRGAHRGCSFYRDGGGSVRPARLGKIYVITKENVTSRPKARGAIWGGLSPRDSPLSGGSISHPPGVCLGLSGLPCQQAGSICRRQAGLGGSIWPPGGSIWLPDLHELPYLIDRTIRAKNHGFARRVVVRKPRLVFGEIRATWNKGTAKARAYCRGCGEGGGGGGVNGTVLKNE